MKRMASSVSVPEMARRIVLLLVPFGGTLM